MTIKAVLFDMGGVLVRLGSFEDMLGASALSADELSKAWILSPAVQEFERGLCDVDSFASRIITEMQLEGTAEEFIERLMALPQGLFPGAATLVTEVASKMTTGILSNTNGLHWSRQRDADVIPKLCQRSYLSYELGLAKPYAEIYEYALADLELPGEEVLFLDDNQVNVDGAHATGMQSALARGPEAAEAALRDHGVL